MPQRVVHSARSVGDHSVVDRCRARGDLVQLVSRDARDMGTHVHRVARTVDGELVCDPAETATSGPSEQHPDAKRRPGTVPMPPLHNGRRTCVRRPAMSECTTRQNERGGAMLSALDAAEEAARRQMSPSGKSVAKLREEEFIAKATLETERRRAQRLAAKKAERRRIARKGLDLYKQAKKGQASPRSTSHERELSSSGGNSPAERTVDDVTPQHQRPLTTSTVTSAGHSKTGKTSMSDRMVAQALGRGVHRQVQLRVIELKAAIEAEEAAELTKQRANYTKRLDEMKEEYERLRREAVPPPAPKAPRRQEDSDDDVNSGDLFHLTGGGMGQQGGMSPARWAAERAAEKEAKEYEEKCQQSVVARRKLASLKKSAFGPENPPPFLRALTTDAEADNRSPRRREPTNSHVDGDGELINESFASQVESEKLRPSTLETIAKIGTFTMSSAMASTDALRGRSSQSARRPRAPGTAGGSRHPHTAGRPQQAQTSRAPRARPMDGMLEPGEDISGRPVTVEDDAAGAQRTSPPRLADVAAEALLQHRAEQQNASDADHTPRLADVARAAAARDRRRANAAAAIHEQRSRVAERETSVTSTGANRNYVIRMWFQWIATVQAARVFANAIAETWSPFDESKRHRALFHPPRGDARVRELAHASSIISRNLFYHRVQHNREKQRQAARVVLDVFVSLRSSMHVARWAVHMFMMKLRFLQRTIRRYQSQRKERVAIWTRQWLKAEPRVIRLAQLRGDPEVKEAAAAQVVRERLQKDAASMPNSSGLGAAANVILKRTAEGGKAKLQEMRDLERDHTAVEMLPQFEGLEVLLPTPPADVHAIVVDLFTIRNDAFRKDYHRFIRAERDARENERWAKKQGGNSFAAAAASVHSSENRQCPTFPVRLRHREVLGFILSAQKRVPANVEQAARIAAGTEQPKQAPTGTTETTQTLLNLVNLLKNPNTLARESVAASVNAQADPAASSSARRMGRRASLAVPPPKPQSSIRRESSSRALDGSPSGSVKDSPTRAKSMRRTLSSPAGLGSSR